MESYENLSFRTFTTKSEADKAINSLKGILLGIQFDKEINEAEISELVEWCTKHKELVNRNPFKDLMDCIKQAVIEQENRVEIINDLYWLCQKYESDSYYYDAFTADMQILQGICHGILSDGVINNAEIFELDRWLENNEHLSSYYPYDELRSLVVCILSDGKVTEDERLRLTAYFNEFVSLNDKQLTKQIELDIKDIKINGICTVDPDISFDGKTFCFTGVAKNYTRSIIQKRITELGGQYHSNVLQTTDYLIVGEGGNPCWVFACYGRKVESAVNLRKQGSRISLIHEFDFWDAVQDA
ncbi:hypothetical protein DYU05_02620 [Mucilaginibacter terrenus]|uniref:BRCT domain-containing protein n=1 Tax=Mucilaginibacter terrenus TaxID=2482727 RepID=A0A3E2NUJ9_9SPHI|nr:BRCT domain-containing protein [Mucilaginibacter terrenus]RFZ84530.1 hypothetical protein DYU05_02620 [Mucilaginibacter terrenus]